MSILFSYLLQCISPHNTSAYSSAYQIVSVKHLVCKCNSPLHFLIWTGNWYLPMSGCMCSLTWLVRQPRPEVQRQWFFASWHHRDSCIIDWASCKHSVYLRCCCGVFRDMVLGAASGHSCVQNTRTWAQLHRVWVFHYSVVQCGLIFTLLTLCNT